MASRLVVLQQSQPSLHSPWASPSSSLLPSSLSEFNGTGFNVSFQVKEIVQFSTISLHYSVQKKRSLLMILVSIQQGRRKVCQPKGAFQVLASSAKKVLVMGGTRFIGVFLSRLLVQEGHQVCDLMQFLNLEAMIITSFSL